MNHSLIWFIVLTVNIESRSVTQMVCEAVVFLALQLLNFSLFLKENSWNTEHNRASLSSFTSIIWWINPSNRCAINYNHCHPQKKKKNLSYNQGFCFVQDANEEQSALPSVWWWDAACELVGSVACTDTDVFEVLTEVKAILLSSAC